MNRSLLYAVTATSLLSVISSSLLAEEMSDAMKSSTAAIEDAFNQHPSKKEAVFGPFDPDNADVKVDGENINAYFYAGLTREQSHDLDVWMVESGVRVLFDDNWSGRANVLMFWDDQKDFFEGMNFGGSGALLYSIGAFNPNFSARPVIGTGFYIANNECDNTTVCDEDVTGGIFPEVGLSIITSGIELYGYTRYVFHPELDDGVQVGVSIGYQL